MQRLAALVPRLTRVLKRDKRVRFAYLYGSVLKRRDARDIDVAVYLQPGAEAWRTAQELAADLERELGFRERADVHALNGAPPAFAFQVLRDGRLLCARKDAENQEWAAHVLSAYQDIKPMLDFHDRRFLAR